MNTPERFNEITKMYEDLKHLIPEHEFIGSDPELSRKILEELKAGRPLESIENWQQAFRRR